MTDLVTRVRTRATVLQPEIELLVMRAALACRYPNPGMIYRELVRRVGDDALGIFVGHENASPGAMGLARHSETATYGTQRHASADNGTALAGTASVSGSQISPLQNRGYIKSSARNDRCMALVVAMLPDSPLMMAPQCPIVYSRGSRMLIRHVGERMREWVMAAGYDRVLSVSLTHSAAAWARSFRWLGEHKTLGTMIEVRF